MKTPEAQCAALCEVGWGSSFHENPKVIPVE